MSITLAVNVLSVWSVSPLDFDVNKKLTASTARKPLTTAQSTSLTRRLVLLSGFLITR